MHRALKACENMLIEFPQFCSLNLNVASLQKLPGKIVSVETLCISFIAVQTLSIISSIMMPLSIFVLFEVLIIKRL